MVVDRVARDKAASLIRRFLSGDINNFDFQDDFPESKNDPALHAIEERLWLHYDDVTEHQCEFPLKSAPESLFQRCALFLESNLEYEWGNLRRHNLAHPIVAILVGEIFHFRKVETAKLKGDYSVWPFFRRGDLETCKVLRAGLDATPDELKPLLADLTPARKALTVSLAALQTGLFVFALISSLIGLVTHSRPWAVRGELCLFGYLLLIGLIKLSDSFASHHR